MALTMMVVLLLCDGVLPLKIEEEAVSNINTRAWTVLHAITRLKTYFLCSIPQSFKDIHNHIAYINHQLL